MNINEIRKNLAPYSATLGAALVLGRENDVIRVGYRSAQDQVEEFTRAGIRYQVNKELAYPEPKAVSSRHYGEIDMTVQREKLADFKERVRAEATRRDEQRKAFEKGKAEEAEKARLEAEEAFQKKVQEEVRKQGTKPTAE